uniref:Rap guanine nucleotide exchange factor 4-like n=1 Tax=Phallusia mammillata TaxID=59560 RepID=A0A6F9DQP4_9ASCI|nr:rap guanine nucleotide exchange factor 4-like [Phallusia mammillata]
MTVKQSRSTPQRSNTVSSSSRYMPSPRSSPGPTHRGEISRIDERHAKGADYVPSYITPRQRLNSDEEDYADMTGASSGNNSPMISHRSSPVNSSMRPRVVKSGSFRMPPRRSTDGSPRTTVNGQFDFKQVSEPDNSRITSPRIPKGLIKEGSFHKDDDDDYEDDFGDYTEMSPTPVHNAQRPPIPQHLPCVEVRPATPTKLFQSMSLSNVASAIPSKRFGFSDSSEDETSGEEEKRKKGNSNLNYRSKSLNAFNENPNSVVRPQQNNKDKQQSPTDAGKAARKYLQHGDTMLSPVKRHSSFGLARSSSRAGKQGGVVSRITKVRQNNSAKNLRDYDDSDSDLEDVPDVPARGTKLQRTTSCLSKPSLGEFERRKSKTLAEQAPFDLDITDEDGNILLPDGAMAGKQQLDGSLLMKLLANDGRTRSLDKKYLEWLAKTSPYASRTSSTSSRKPRSKANSTKDLKSPVSSDDDYEAVEDDEAFEKFTKVIQGGYNHQAAAKLKSPDKAPSMSLASFAEQHSQMQKQSFESLERVKSKDPESVKQEIAEIKRSMTLKPLPPAENAEFSDLAQAFYEDFHKKDKKAKKSDKKADKKQKEGKKHKDRSLRKSFRFGSKKKLTMSTPELNHQAKQDSLRSPTQEELNSGPQGMPSLKPPLGLSPNHGKKGLSRERAASSSNSLKRSEKKHDYKDSWNKTRTLERGMFPSNLSSSTNFNSTDNKELTVTDISWESNLKSMGKSTMSKSGTLGRLFSKRVKERKGLDVTDSGSRVFSPECSDSYDSDGKSGTLERSGPVEVDLTPSQRYFKLCNISKGLVMKHDGPDSSEGIDIAFLQRSKSGSKKPAHFNKYATITGIYSAQQQSSPKKLSRHLSAEQTGKQIETSTEDDSRRSKRTRASLRGLSNSLARNTKSSALKNFAIGETDEANDYVLKQEVEAQKAPLRTRPRQKVHPLYPEPSPRLLATARLLYRLILQTQPDLLRKHKADEENVAESFYTDADVYEQSAFGHELVTWLQARTQPKQLMVEDRDVTSSVTSSRSRWNVGGMWQVLQEEGLITHVRREHYFEDSNYLYQFHKDVTNYVESIHDELPIDDSSSTRSSVDSGFGHSNGENVGDDFPGSVSRSSSIASTTRLISSEMSLMMMNDTELSEDAITHLQQNAPDALFRLALRKLPEERSSDELMMIYEEILHIKALAHLSDSIKRELAGVLQFEHHHESGITLFNQGDEGTSWYIILRGSVDVAIHRKGVVCRLHDGDDFGNLAIINDAPRAASIVLAEKNCQFLRVDKFDFVRILKDVEANTVRLKEHDKDVLILQKILARSSIPNSRNAFENGTSPQIPVAATPTRQSHKYSISAGTADKILEHLLEYLQPWNIGRREEAMEDFIIMYPVFMTTDHLCNLLLKHYRSEKADNVECSRSLKRKVVYFTVRWSHISSYLFKSDSTIESFLKDLQEDVQLDILDNSSYSLLRDDLNSVFTNTETDICNNATPKQSLISVGESVHRIQTEEGKARPVRSTDQVLLKVHNMHKTYTTVRISISSNVDEIISAVAEKMSRPSRDLKLFEVQEDGDVMEVSRKQTSIATSLKINSRLYICTQEERTALGALKWSPQPSSSCHLEVVSSLEIAYHVTQYDWELLNNVHVMEFVYKVFGAHKFNGVTSNLDIFTRRFNQLAYWAPTEICSCQNLNKRVQLLRKFIKIAQHLKMYQNMNGFMAMMIGIGNQAVSRLYNTWEKLPAKYRKLVQEYESILDPSRNHRSYRLHVATLQSPVILYLPLLLKDMTFQHEGNDSVKSGLINFEKMHMISNSIRTVIQGCANRIDEDHILESTKTAEESRNYVRQLQVITDQKLLNEMSNKLEPKR